MAWVGYSGPNRVVSKFGKTFWNTRTDEGETDPAYFVEVSVESEIDWFKKDPYFEVRESLADKVGRATRRAKRAKTTGKAKTPATTSIDVSAPPRSKTQPGRPAAITGGKKRRG